MHLSDAKAKQHVVVGVGPLQNLATPLGLRDAARSAEGKAQRDLALLPLQHRQHAPPQRLQPLAGHRADRNRVRIAVLPDRPLRRIGQPIHLVEHQQPRRDMAPGRFLLQQRVERLVDDVELHLRHGIGDIQHDQQQVGVEGFLKGGPEGGDEVVRQVAHEADGVGEHGAGRLAQRPGAGARRERCEDAIVGVRPAPAGGFGERIEEGGLAGVGVADETDGTVLAVALPHLTRPALQNLGDPGLEHGLAPLHEPAVDFDLRFAGASGADADGGSAGDLPEVAPHGAQARVGIFELRQFYLQAGGIGRRAVGEDIEDQFRSVDDLAADGLLEVPYLGRGEVVVEDDDRRAERLLHRLDLINLALADVGSCIEALAVLDHLPDDGGTGRFGQGAQFSEGIARIEARLGQVAGDEDGLFGKGAGLAGFVCGVTHTGIRESTRADAARAGG